MRVLVVEEHAELAETIANGLRREGMAVDVANDGASCGGASCGAPRAWVARQPEQGQQRQPAEVNDTQYGSTSQELEYGAAR
jgi:CheY-like chemotaxis protein